MKTDTRRWPGQKASLKVDEIIQCVNGTTVKDDTRATETSRIVPCCPTFYADRWRHALSSTDTLVCASANRTDAFETAIATCKLGSNIVLGISPALRTGPRSNDSR